MFLLGTLGSALITYFYKITVFDNWPKFRPVVGLFSGFIFEMATGWIFFPLGLLAQLMLAALVGLSGVGLCYLYEELFEM